MQSKAKTVNLFEDHEAFFPISFHNSILHSLSVNFLDDSVAQMKPKGGTPLACYSQLNLCHRKNFTFSTFCDVKIFT